MEIKKLNTISLKTLYDHLTLEDQDTFINLLDGDALFKPLKDKFTRNELILLHKGFKCSEIAILKSYKYFLMELDKEFETKFQWRMFLVQNDEDNDKIIEEKKGMYGTVESFLNNAPCYATLLDTMIECFDQDNLYDYKTDKLVFEKNEN